MVEKIYYLLYHTHLLIICFFILIFSVYITYPRWQNTADKFIRTLSNSNQRTLKILLIITSIFLIWKTSFIQDDAFISFRYAKNFVSNSSLSWNFDEGPVVQGYTNFLWVILSIIPIFLGLKIEIFVLITGILLGFLTLLTTYKLSRFIFIGKTKSYAVIFLLATNLSFLSYCTGGLETQLVTLLVTATWLFSLQLKFFYQKKESLLKHNKLRYSYLIECSISFAIGILSLMAFLTRIDSILITVPCIFYSLYLIRFNNIGLNIIKPISIIFIPLIIGIFLYFNFALNYYGDFLPNTFYLKTNLHSYEQIQFGILYIFQFIIFYGFLPILLLTFLVKECSIEKTLDKPKSIHLYFIILSLFSSLLYIIKIGGDFMEFRFLVPILPLFYIILVNYIFTKGKRIVATALITLPIISASNFGQRRYHGVEHIKQLNARLYDKRSNWIGIGKRLDKIFPTKKSSIIIGVTPAGAIPYFSELKTIDLLGLNDIYIAKKGLNIGSRAGHIKGPSYEYLNESNINLLIGHPQVRSISSDFNKERFFNRNCWFLKGEECIKLQSSRPIIITMQIDSNHTLDLIYLRRSEYVDKAISLGQFKIIQIDRGITMQEKPVP